ncbi:hypothetical protein SYNPS1DRAFT_31673, partial [Syncephalis pseudoplumigaleata]
MADELLLFCLVDGDPPLEAFPIHISSSCSVGDLKDHIKSKDPDSFGNVSAKRLVLWKVSIPVDTVDVKKELLLATIDTKEELGMPTDELSKVFSVPPAKKTIHIIVERPPPPASVQAPAGSSLPPHPRPEFSLEVAHEKLARIASDFFDSESSYAQYLKKFVQGKPDLPITQGAVPGLPRVDSRGAAEGREAPSLLFFDLPGPRDATRSSNVAEKALDKWPGLRHLPLFGVSGCGKTRTLLELLSRTWGFYFNASSDDIGSDDIQVIIDALSANPATYLSSDREHNRDNMRYLTCGLLYARLLILDYCLNVPGSTDTFDSRRWLLLQAATPVFNDVFAALFRRIADLFHGASTLGSRIIDITQCMFDKVQQQLHGRPTASPLRQPRFILALDEAQALSRHSKGFFTDSSGKEARAIVAPMLHAFRRIANPGSPYKFCVMPSGTGLSRYELELTRGSAADDKVEPNDHEESEEAGMIKYFVGWADEDAVSDYVKRLGQA